MLYYARGSKTDAITPDEVRAALKQVFDAMGPKKRVLAIPPDFTRFNSYAGPITGMVEEYYGDVLTDVLPALGTHTAMTPEQIAGMFPGVPESKFRVHDWRDGVATLGENLDDDPESENYGVVSFPVYTKNGKKTYAVINLYNLFTSGTGLSSRAFGLIYDALFGGFSTPQGSGGTSDVGRAVLGFSDIHPA